MANGDDCKKGLTIAGVLNAAGGVLLAGVIMWAASNIITNREGVSNIKTAYSIEMTQVKNEVKEVKGAIGEVKDILTDIRNDQKRRQRDERLD
jgi:hypothetical protein